MEWTIGELAEQVSAALAPTARQGGRGRDVPNERVIRWYSTIGLLDPPSARRGRVAVYGRRHLLQLIAIKRRQADGRTIAEIQAELAGATDRTLETIAGLPEPRPEHVPEHRPGRSTDRGTEREAERRPGRGGGATEAPSPAPARPRFWTGAPAPAASHPAPTPVPHPVLDPALDPALGPAARPAPPTPAPVSGTPPAPTALTTPLTPPTASAPPPPASSAGPDVERPPGRTGRITGMNGPEGPEGPDARPGGLVPPAVPTAVTVHGVRLADGVTLLLDGGHGGGPRGGRAPSPDELAEIAAASRELLSLLRERGLTPPEGLHP